MLNLTRVTLACLLLLGLTGLRPVGAEDDALTRLTDDVREVLVADDPGAAAAPLAWRLTAERTAPGHLEDAIMTARQTAGWAATEGNEPRRETFTLDVNGQEHTVFVQLPSTYTPERAWPVLLWLHGGVSRPQDGGGESGLRGLGGDAEEEGYILIAPSGRQGAVWWDPAGMQVIEESLRTLCRKAHVDARRIAAAGFSDGASGCWHLLAHAPERFCCFIPLHGHPGLTRNLYGPCFTSNIGSRPVFATNGELDQLYPSERIEPLVRQLEAAGGRITWKDVKGSQHTMRGLDAHWTEAKAFWKQHPLAPNARELAFETNRTGLTARRGWIEILAIDPANEGTLAKTGGHLEPLPQRRLLGVQIDQQFAGPGLKLALVNEDTAASEAGLKAGDILIGVDGEELEGGAAGGNLLRARIQAYDPKGKDPLALKVKRGEETLELGARPRIDALPGYEEPVARIEASWDGNNRIRIKTRHVGAVRIHIDPLLMKARIPLRIEIDGKQVHQGAGPFHPAVRLVEAAQRGDGAPAYMGTLRFVLKAQSKAE